MNHFAITAWDAEGAKPLRDEHRAAHFVHIAHIIERIAVAGPLKDDGGAIIGSLVVVSCTSRAEAEAILKSDPYFAAGVWARWEIHPYLAAAGVWVGGTIW